MVQTSAFRSKGAPATSEAMLHSSARIGGAMSTTDYQTPEPDRIAPSPRTLRKAREQVKQMVNTEVSPRRIKNYLHRWGTWWVRTSGTWGKQDLLMWFLEVCRDPAPAAYAGGLYSLAVNKSRTMSLTQHSAFEGDSAVAF